MCVIVNVFRPLAVLKNKHILTSSEWWKEQANDLFALTEEYELGMMSTMTTITHNDLSPELLATVRRGPFSSPTEVEQIEYLLSSHSADRKRCDFENYALEHVLSFQRRVAGTKQEFMVRGKRTPLGITKDYWDRTEAQMRGVPHAHILSHYEPRELPKDRRGQKHFLHPRHVVHSRTRYLPSQTSCTTID